MMSMIGATIAPASTAMAELLSPMWARYWAFSLTGEAALRPRETTNPMPPNTKRSPAM